VRGSKRRNFPLTFIGQKNNYLHTNTDNVQDKFILFRDVLFRCIYNCNEGTSSLITDVSRYVILTKSLDSVFSIVETPYSDLYPQKLALISPTSGGRSVGIVRLRTTGHGVCL
jgi:hypothetical protein